MNNDKQKHPIAYRGYSSQSFISFSSYLEHGTYVKDIIFIELRNGIKHDKGYRYDKENALKMLVDSIELRALSYAMKEIMKYRSNDLGYLKHTFSGIGSDLFLGYANNEKNEAFFINVKSGNKKVSVKFSKWDFASLADSIVIIADDTERSLYKFQRMLKKTT